MSPELPSELTNLSDEEKEERRRELIEESAETRRQLDKEQEELLESFVDEAEVEHIETEVILPGGNSATINIELTGAFLEQFEHIEDTIDRIQSDDESAVKDISRAMDRTANILADMTAEPKYSKDVFYRVYRIAGPEALGKHLEVASKAIERSQKKGEQN